MDTTPNFCSPPISCRSKVKGHAYMYMIKLDEIWMELGSLYQRSSQIRQIPGSFIENHCTAMLAISGCTHVLQHLSDFGSFFDKKNLFLVDFIDFQRILVIFPLWPARGACEWLVSYQRRVCKETIKYRTSTKERNRLPQNYRPFTTGCCRMAQSWHSSYCYFLRTQNEFLISLSINKNKPVIRDFLVSRLE